MAALTEGPVYDVTVEHRTLVIDGDEVPVVHARPDGMPVALQIVGPFGSDALVLALARRIETVLAFRDRHPLPRVAS